MLPEEFWINEHIKGFENTARHISVLNCLEMANKVDDDKVKFTASSRNYLRLFY